jgi:hypothetical protein
MVDILCGNVAFQEWREEQRRKEDALLGGEQGVGVPGEVPGGTPEVDPEGERGPDSQAAPLSGVSPSLADHSRGLRHRRG